LATLASESDVEFLSSLLSELGEADSSPSNTAEAPALWACYVFLQCRLRHIPVYSVSDSIAVELVCGLCVLHLGFPAAPSIQ
jgi:hypothetical protein